MTAREVEIRDGDEWITPNAAAIKGRLGQDFLHYSLRDGTIGLAQPKNWRYKTSTESRLYHLKKEGNDAVSVDA